jgi:Na+/proline symporter
MTYLTAILIYLLVLAGIGVYKSRQVKTQADFSVAGRSLSPWVMVCTMLAVWIGTGSIVGNAGKTYLVGMAGLWLPLGTFVGMILLSLIAYRAREIEALSVPEIIGRRYGKTARMLAVIALIIAYMVIVSYQFNAGGMVLEVIAGKKDKVFLGEGSTLTRNQVRKRYFQYETAPDWTGTDQFAFQVRQPGSDDWSDASEIYTIRVVPAAEVSAAQKTLEAETAEQQGPPSAIVIKKNSFTRIALGGYDEGFGKHEGVYRLTGLPDNGRLYLHEPVLTAHTATIVAAVFIVLFTVLAGLLSLAFADVVTGTIITVTLLLAFPVLLAKAGGFSGMAAAYDAMGDRARHMQFTGVFSIAEYINYLLPVFLLVMGDANQYQRIFASKNAKGARTAVIIMIFVALLIEELIIAESWIAGSMTPDPENGRYILIYAARHFLPGALGILFMITVVGIIISTADSFLLVPATTFIKDVYQAYINPSANEKRVVFMSRVMVVLFGVIAWLVSLAFAESTTVFEKALYAFTVYGSAITPCLVAALFWKRATTAGAISSILAGTVTTLLWGEILQQLVAEHVSAELAKLDAVLPALALSVVCLIVVSLLTRQKAG